MPKTTSNKDFNGAECKPGIQIYSNTWSKKQRTANDFPHCRRKVIKQQGGFIEYGG